MTGASSHWLALAGCIVLTACAQILLKRGAVRGRHFVASFLDPVTISGYSLLAVVTVLSVYAFQEIELKTGTAWISATYLLVVLLARPLLGEPLTRPKILGSVLVVAGGVAFALG